MAPRTGMGLAQVEKPVADALAAICGQQHGFGAVEHRGQGDAGAFEGRPEGVGMLGQRRAGGRAHQPRAVKRADQHRARRTAIAVEIAPLVVQIAVIKIGPVAEHREAQRGHLVQRGLQTRTGQHPDVGHDTCRTQSARL